MANQIGGMLARSRARRLAYLLAGTALASAAFAPEAAAVCTVNPVGVVNCTTNTTTTNTTNLNGAITNSTDRIQEFNGVVGISSSVDAAVTVDGFGLNLLLSNAAGNNPIALGNNGLITTNQAGVAALQINGNGGSISYSGSGLVTHTGAGTALLITNTGSGAVIMNLLPTSTIQSAGGVGLNILTFGGSVTVQGLIGAGTVIGTTGAILATNSGALTVQGLALIQGTNGNAIFALSGGNLITIEDNLQITGNGSPAIVANSGGGALVIQNNGNITSTGGGILANSSGGLISVANNGNISGINASSGGATISITGNGNIIANNDNGIFAQTGGGGFVSITGNGNITGARGIQATTGGAGAGVSIEGNGAITGTLVGAISVQTSGGNISIGSVTPNGAITGFATAILASSQGANIGITSGGAITSTAQHGIDANSGSGSQLLVLNHNVSGGINGLNLTASTGTIAVFTSGTLTGNANAILGNITSAGVGSFDIANAGTINGAINVAASNPASAFTNFGAWNTGTGNSTYNGVLQNTGFIIAQNAFAGQTVNVVSYQGAGTLRLDLGDRVTATGVSNLTGGTLNIVMAPNSPLAQSNVVLTSAGGLGGTTFATTSVTIPGVVATVSYTPTQVIVNVPAIQLGAGSNLNQNQQNVATSISNFFNGGGTLPGGFAGLLALPGPALANALSQISGEVATGLQPSANLSMGMFLNAMIDPFVTGRTGGFGSAVNYAPEQPSRVEVAAREAFAADMPVKAPAYVTELQRWSIWGAAYGGQNRTDGDTIVGSNDLRATAAGFAAGADYRVSRDTVVGMAVAVGQTRWSVAAPALGKGHSDVGQVGAYASTRWDNMYLSGAVAFAWHRAGTQRTVTIAGTDRLEADFDATSFGGRLESGYRFGGLQYGFTPYAAVQVQSLHTPGYSEFATQGVNQFALTFASQTTTDTRSELGFWADTRFPFADNTVVLRARAAWVHDYNPGSRINPAFQGLPGASFTTNGAAAPSDAALTSAVAEMRLTSGWTLISKFDGEFSGRSTTVTGTGTARYTW